LTGGDRTGLGFRRCGCCLRGDTISADACINERIAAGETLVVTFTEAGDYDITCTLHAAMHTVIHVE
jgi:plastocyanin